MISSSSIKMQNKKVAVLADTSLCAIVRDEIMNPAGGIERFAKAILPHVEQAVIVDTGSIDGTREALEQLQFDFPNLKVFDYKFRDYADARNFSLSKVKTSNALVLDADELITKADFSLLVEETMKLYDLRAIPLIGSNFEIVEVRSKEILQAIGHNPRLFKKNLSFIYRNCRSGRAEYLYEGDSDLRLQDDNLLTQFVTSKIYHFRASGATVDQKYYEWYSHPERWGDSPSKFPSFNLWRAINPQRDKFN